MVSYSCFRSSITEHTKAIVKSSEGCTEEIYTVPSRHGYRDLKKTQVRNSQKGQSCVAHTKISNTVAAMQKNKPGTAGEAMLYAAIRVRVSSKRLSRGCGSPVERHQLEAGKVFSIYRRSLHPNYITSSQLLNCALRPLQGRLFFLHPLQSTRVRRITDCALSRLCCWCSPKKSIRWPDRSLRRNGSKLHRPGHMQALLIYLLLILP